MLHLALVLVLLPCALGVNSAATPLTPEAYVTLLYGDAFVLGVRVLGQSLKETGTTRNRVALATGGLSAAAELTLTSDGWRVIRVNPVQNPAQGPQDTGFPPRFWAVYTKLLIFQLTEYRKVVFLDADTIVTRNMDALFKCPGFCAALRHSERFNSGVMSLGPSQELYDDMMKKIKEMPSYTGGDQGFLNSYFTGFAHAPLFDPDTPYTPDQYRYMRLPTIFNADVGLYVVNSNRWMLPRESLYVIHYTLGTFKPWVWWTSWLIRENPAWEAIRYRLPKDSRGLAHGLTARQLFAERWLVLGPWLILIALGYFYLPGSLGSITGSLSSILGPWARSESKRQGGTPSGADALLKLQQGGGNGECFPKLFVPASIFGGFLCVGLAAAVAILIVPPEVDPLYGWILSFEWGFLVLGLAYGKLLNVCYRMGKSAGNHASIQAIKHTVKPWVETIGSAATIATVMLLAPWLGRLLGINSFVGNILATVFIGLAIILLLTVQFMFLPVQWYVAGRMASPRME